MLAEFRTDPLLEGRMLLDPIKTDGRLSSWTRSRLVVMDDGTPVPVLRFLAMAKFGEWHDPTHFPVWTDGDWMNETIENVSIVERELPSLTTRRRSRYGIPAGTAEYRRKWMQENKDKMKASQARYYAKKKETQERAAALLAERFGGSGSGEDLIARLEREIAEANPSDAPEDEEGS